MLFFLLTNTNLASYAVEETQVQKQIVATSKDLFFSYINKHKIGFIVTGLALLAGSIIWALTSDHFRDQSPAKPKGFKSSKDVINLLQEKSNGIPDAKIYGQEDALESVLSTVEYRISERDKKGEVIYILGKPNTGRKTLAESVGKAILNNPEREMLIIKPRDISYEKSLGEQLFGNRSKILNHVLKYGKDGAVIVIEDYDLMKELSDPKNWKANKFEFCFDKCQSYEGRAEDKTADVKLADIAELGKYFGIDFSRTIIFVTSSETKLKFETNFGIDGIKNGCPQRVSVVELKNLVFDDYRKIVIDVLNEVRKEVTDLSEDHKVSSLYFSEETTNALTNIMQSHSMQGRIKIQKIFIIGYLLYLVLSIYRFPLYLMKFS